MVAASVDSDGVPEDVVTFIVYPVTRKRSYLFEELFEWGMVIGKGSYAVCETCIDRQTNPVNATKIFGSKARERDPGIEFPYDITQVHKELSLLMSLESNDIVCLKAIFDEITAPLR